MKHLKKWSCSFLIVSALLTACQDDGSFDSFPKEENLLIPQAREFYENVISEAAENGTLIQNRNMSPGEVTPRWHEAYLKQDTQYEYVYVPIHAERNYIRQVEMKKNGHKKTYNVYISQTLCVRKDREGKYSAAYITMMPSLSHYRRNKNQFTEKVIKSETLYGDFSGYVAYNNIATSGLMVIDKVEKGKCQWALSRETPIEKDSIWTLFKEAYKNIYSINISLTRHTIDGGSLEEVVITPEPDGYYCVFCNANVPYDHVCSDHSDGGNESEPWDGNDGNGLDVGGNSGSGSGGGGGSWGGGASNNGGQTSTTQPSKISLPPSSTITAKFNEVAKMTPIEVAKLIGGKVLYNYQNNPEFNNGCTIRLSYALNLCEGDHKISFTEGLTISGDVNHDGVKEWYYFRVKPMINYLDKKYGMHETVTYDDIAGKTGIIGQTDCKGWGEGGHMDIWDGTNTISSDHPYAECQTLYFWNLK